MATPSCRCGYREGHVTTHRGACAVRVGPTVCLLASIVVTGQPYGGSRERRQPFGEPAAVDRDHGASDVAGTGRSQKLDDLSDLLGPAEAVERDPRQEELLIDESGLDEALLQLGADGPWGYPVDPDSTGRLLDSE